MLPLYDAEMHWAALCLNLKIFRTFKKAPCLSQRAFFFYITFQTQMTKKSKNKIATNHQIENCGSAGEKVSAFKNIYLMMCCCMPLNWPEHLYHKW